MSIYEKLQILTDAAKYDVACTSSGVERKGDGTGIGNCKEGGNLSQLFCGWKVYFTSEDFIYERVYL